MPSLVIPRSDLKREEREREDPSRWVGTSVCHEIKSIFLAPVLASDRYVCRFDLETRRKQPPTSLSFTEFKLLRGFFLLLLLLLFSPSLFLPVLYRGRWNRLLVFECATWARFRLILCAIREWLVECLILSKLKDRIKKLRM